MLSSIFHQECYQALEQAEAFKRRDTYGHSLVVDLRAFSLLLDSIFKVFSHLDDSMMLWF